MNVTQLTDAYLAKGYDIGTAISMAVSADPAPTSKAAYREEIVSGSVTRIVKVLSATWQIETNRRNENGIVVHPARHIWAGRPGNQEQQG